VPLADLTFEAEPEADAGASLAIRGLARSFGAAKVLRGLDLEVPAGQFVAIVGRSGCGKSTLLRLIAGLDEPTEGRLRFGGARAEQSSHTLVRVMFQEPRRNRLGLGREFAADPRARDRGA
jgi:sulfonate transport system ATP-binding protein